METNLGKKQFGIRKNTRNLKNYTGVEYYWKNKTHNIVSSLILKCL